MFNATTEEIDMNRTDAYYRQPCRVCYRRADGRIVSRLCGYGLIERMRAAGRLIAAYSTSTGRSIA